MMYETPSHGQTARLEDYIRAVRARLPLVVAAILAFVLIGYWVSQSRTATYSSSAAVALGPTPVGSINANLLAPKVERESEILASNPVAAEVVDALGLEVGGGELLAHLSVKFVPGSSVLQLSYSGSEPMQVAETLNQFAQIYVSQRELEAETYYTDRVRVLGEQVSTVDDKIAIANVAIESSQANRSQVVLSDVSDERSVRLIEIDAELASLRSDRQQSYIQLRETERILDAAQLSLNTRQETAEVIRLAEPAKSPDGLPNGVYIVGAGLLGMLAGVASAFVLERLDTTARDEASIGLAIGSPVVGEIPSFGFGNRAGAASLIMLSDSKTTKTQRTREAFRRLRSSLQFLAPREGGDRSMTLVFTSAHPGEGKTTVAANTAVAIAQAGKRVGLISADMRRPKLETLFGLSSEQGLSGYLGGTEDIPTVLETMVDNLWVLPAGPPPANPSELLGSTRLVGLLEQIRTDLDFVIIDTPPILSTADTLVVASKADGVVVVVDSRRTDTEDLLQVRTELERSGAKILGGILNRDRRRRGPFFRGDRYAYNKLET